jgi:hypothetical protein
MPLLPFANRLARRYVRRCTHPTIPTACFDVGQLTRYFQVADSMVMPGSSDGQEPGRKRNRNPNAHSGTPYNFLPQVARTAVA